MEKHTDNRICFIGDSFVAGIGDAEYKGWVGRAVEKANNAGNNITLYNLGIRRDTSTDILLRWEDECKRRFNTNSNYYIVFSFGANDMTIENGELRVSTNQSIDNFEKIITKAKINHKVLVVSPPPVCEIEQDERIIELDGYYKNVANKLSIPYISITQKLLDNGEWKSEALANDGAHPNAKGYAYLASLVSSSSKWFFN